MQLKRLMLLRCPSSRLVGIPSLLLADAAASRRGCVVISSPLMADADASRRSCVVISSL